MLFLSGGSQVILKSDACGNKQMSIAIAGLLAGCLEGFKLLKPVLSILQNLVLFNTLLSLNYIFN